MSNEQEKQAHECYQVLNIDSLVASDKKQNDAIFGNVETGDHGMVSDIKDIKKMLEDMKPTYNELNSWGTFFKKGKDLGIGLAMLITMSGVIFGGLYAIKEWIKK